MSVIIILTLPTCSIIDVTTGDAFVRLFGLKEKLRFCQCCSACCSDAVNLCQVVEADWTEP